MVSGFLALAVLLLFAVWSAPADAATIFTVNRTGDARDRNLDDGVCDALRERGKQCSLRAAIQEANDTFGPDAIKFDIGGPASVKTVSPTRPLPTITDAVTVDGYSQPGASANTRAEGNDAVLKVQLSGAEAGRRADGLQITAADSTVKGLVIGRFRGSGIRVVGAGATGNSIEGNFVGVDPSGTQKAGNRGAGVRIGGGGSANVVGGAEPAQRNVISGNGDCPNYGFNVSISSSSGNLVQGNYIGTDKSGASALKDCRGISQFSGGVSIEGYRGLAANNTVGGTVGGAGNVISGNLYGIWSGGAGNTANKVEGNFIGTDASGTTNVGNGQAGVAIFNTASNNTVGGSVNGAGNVISANLGEGVDVGAGSSGTKVEGNTIRDNGSDGVTIVGDHNTVGGMTPGAGNKIFDNERNGVRIVGYTGNRVLSNEIFANAGLGIDLGAYINNTLGVTPNDEDDPDAESNNLQNYPVIGSAIRSASTGTTTLIGTLNSNPSQNYTIQCFLTDAGGDPSGHGEGETLLDTTTTATNADGDSPAFTCTSEAPDPDDKVSMTATNTATGDTSEFSQNVAVTTGT